MSETKDSNAAALDGNPEPMDQTEDNSMPSAQQQVIFFFLFAALVLEIIKFFILFCDGMTSKVASKVAREVLLNIIMFPLGRKKLSRRSLED